MKSLKSKILFMVLGSCGIFAILTIYMTLQIRNSAVDLQQLSDRFVPQLMYIADLEVETQNAFRLMLRATVDLDDPEALERTLKGQKASRELIRKTLEDFSALEMSESLKTLFLDSRESFALIEKEFERSDKVFESSSTPSSEKRSQIIDRLDDADFLKLRDDHFGKLLKVEEFIENRIQTQGDQGQAEANRAAIAATIGTASTSVIVVSFAFLFSGRIVRTIKAESENLVKAGIGLSTASQQLNASASNLTKEVSQSAAAIEETSASLTEISSLINSNTEKIEKSEKFSEDSVRVVSSGKDSIMNLVNTMKDISVSSKSISEIANMIEDIAFQTNLLALNASVEAARAGEHGRGFSVVADAVRSLAQKSSTSAQQVSKLIQQTLVHVSAGEKMADLSQSAILEVETTIHHLRNISKEISVASKEQNAGVNQIVTAISQLDTSVQQNAATSEELASAASGVSSESQNLESITKNLNFVVEGKIDDQNGRQFELRAA